MNSIEQRQSDPNVLQHGTNRSQNRLEKNTKRKHTPIKLVQKIEICKIKSTNPTIKNVELASRYGIGESTITGILKKQRHYLSLLPNNYTTNLCREKPSKYPTVEWLFGLTK